MDRDFKTLGIIVKRENRGERNVLLSLLTPDMGLIDVLSFGGGRGASSYRAPLYGEGVFSLERKNGSVVYLKDTQIISEHEWVKDSIEKVGLVSLFSELVIKSRSADGGMYKLYTSVLDSLTDENADRAAVFFLTHFLLSEGLSGDWETCPMCGRKYDEKEILGFSTLSSSAVCSSCDTLSGTLILPPNARRYCRRVSESTLGEALACGISPEAAKRIRRYLIRSLEYIFPSRLMTIESGLIS